MSADMIVQTAAKLPAAESLDADAVPWRDCVRVATPRDRDAILDLLNLAWRENAMMPVDWGQVRAFVDDATCGRIVGVIGVVDSPFGGVGGSVGLSVGRFWYSPEWHLEERWNFVRSDLRTSRAARAQLEFAKWFSESMKLALLVGVLTNTRTEAKVRMYAAQMRMMGAFFVHNIAAAGGPMAQAAAAEVDRDMRANERKRTVHFLARTMTTVSEWHGG